MSFMCHYTATSEALLQPPVVRRCSLGAPDCKKPAKARECYHCGQVQNKTINTIKYIEMPVIYILIIGSIQKINKIN
jgi:hypothetical protein